MNEQRLHQVFEASARIPLKGQLWSYPTPLIVPGFFIAYELTAIRLCMGSDLVALAVFRRPGNGPQVGTSTTS